jgi:hypothetical protein
MGWNAASLEVLLQGKHCKPSTSECLFIVFQKMKRRPIPLLDGRAGLQGPRKRNTSALVGVLCPRSRVVLILIQIVSIES